MRTYLTKYYGERGGKVSWSSLQGSDYVVDECGTCGLLFQRWVPDEDLAAELYEAWIDPVFSLEYEHTRHIEGALALQIVDLLQVRLDSVPSGA